MISVMFFPLALLHYSFTILQSTICNPVASDYEVHAKQSSIFLFASYYYCLLPITNFLWLNQIEPPNKETLFRLCCLADFSKINDTFRTFYSQLYTSELPQGNTLMDNFLKPLNMPMISFDSKNRLDEPITQEELCAATSSLQSGKSPVFLQNFSKHFHHCSYLNYV